MPPSPHPSISTSIPFSLPGRRTLSEILPSETISLPLRTIHRSPWLSRILALHCPTHSTVQVIPLCDTDPAGFKVYVEWLASGRIYGPRCTRETLGDSGGGGSGAGTNSSASTSTSTSTRPFIPTQGIFFRDAIDLLYAHILGSKIQCADFCDAIIDTLARVLHCNQEPDLGVLQILFTEKDVRKELVGFVVEWMFRVERGMVEKLRGLDRNGESSDMVEWFWGGNEGRCRFHIHEPGECYRDIREDGKQNVGLGRDKSLPALPPGHRQQASDSRIPTLQGTARRFSSLRRQPVQAKQAAQEITNDETSKRSHIGLSQTEALVAECLGRLQDNQRLSRLDQGSKWSSQNTPRPLVSISGAQDLSNGFGFEPAHSSTPTDLAVSISSSTNSAVILPSPDPPNQAEPSLAIAAQSTRLQQRNSASLSRKASSILTCSTATSVRRKPVAPRGEDWLEQYDKINSMMDNTAMLMKPLKKSRRSRFLERFESSKSGFGVLEPDLKYLC